MWENTVITNAGIELLKNALSGGTITVTAIKSGAGKVDVSALKSQTAVSSIKQSGTVQGVTKTDETIKIGVLFSNAGLSAGYSMTQLGIYAKGSTGSEVLFAISQNTTGKEVPSESAMPSWSLVHNFYIKLNNDVTMTATVDPEGYVTFETMQTALNTHTGNKSNPHGVTKSQIGLGNVENKSSAAIRGELTNSNVTTALGFTPAKQTDMTDAQDAITQLNSDTKSIIQFLGNMTTPNNSEGIIHANWPDNMAPIAIRVKKYDQWRYNVLGMALYGKELYLIEIPSAYQGCPCEVICYKSN